MAKSKKYVYFFGGGKADGKAEMKNLLGGKGANLAEMANLGLPVPAGFTITTEVCTLFYDNNRKYPEGVNEQVDKNMRKTERVMGRKFGDPKDPLLISVRSGARKSMPGMMETVLNIGLTSKTIPGMIERTQNPRFVWDAYRRLITMYADVVMEKSMGIHPKDGEGIRQMLEEIMEDMKKKKGVTEDTDLDAEDLEKLCGLYRDKVKEEMGQPFPDTPEDQLWGGISAVFLSWMGKRAIEYRRIERIPGHWGTAVNVQAMVFGNMGDNSGTGVGFTRDPATGENVFYGEWLPNAQGEDVVAGIRTPLPINEAGKTDHNKHLPSLEREMPAVYKKLDKIQRDLERHYKDMQDLEFTIEDGKLWMLQTRVGKRNGVAAVKMAVDMYKQKLIDAETAVRRVTPDALIQVLLPMVDPDAERDAEPIAKGLPAGPGGAAGKIVFTADEAYHLGAEKNQKVILVRHETNPEDVHGMHAAQAILTSKGGMTSHAALVARGWGKCCIVGCGDVDIDAKNRVMRVGGKEIKEGEWVTLNGTAGFVYEGKLPLVDPKLEENKEYSTIIKLADKYRTIGVRANADTPSDATKALNFGAEGIGLFRTEHMFYGEGSEKPLFLLRKMIASGSEKQRRSALDQLFKYMKKDIKSTLKVMKNKAVTIRLLDPPLHEFVPHEEAGLKKLADSLDMSLDTLKKRVENLRESNPMMGHRGVRLGVTYPEISEMQMRAILEAAVELSKEKVRVLPEVMVPVTCDASELADQREIYDRVYEETKKKFKVRKINALYGTMIEIPRATLTANRFAEVAEFFSFGTNDLTQMGFGFSRDDIGGFLPDYLTKKLLPVDPFQSIDQEGIGELIKIGIERGRQTKPDLKIGICGEHGGDPESVKFCFEVGMDYVSCSPFRVPLARLAAAHAALDAGVTGGEAEKKAAASKGGAKKKKTGGKSKK